MGGGFIVVVGMLLIWASTLCSRRARRSFAGSLIIRVLERDGAALTTDPASEERESSWKVVGLIFLLDISSIDPTAVTTTASG
jgi:hypothetical protein